MHSLHVWFVFEIATAYGPKYCEVLNSLPPRAFSSTSTIIQIKGASLPKSEYIGKINSGQHSQQQTICHLKVQP